MTRAVAALGLALLYVAALGSAGPADLALGAAIGAALALRFAPSGGSLRGAARAVAALPRFAWEVARSVALGSWHTALVVLRRRPADRMGHVEVPIGERSERAVAVSALVACLSPGTLLVEVNRDRGVLVFHVLDASRPDEVREELQRFYEEVQRPIVP